MINCKKCGALLPIQDINNIYLICEKCGYDNERSDMCPICGEELLIDNQCPCCGFDATRSLPDTQNIYSEIIILSEIEEYEDRILKDIYLIHKLIKKALGEDVLFSENETEKIINMANMTEKVLIQGNLDWIIDSLKRGF